MVVATARLSLFLGGNESLKAKRAALRPLLAKVRHRFNVAASEVGSQDDLERAVVGLAVVSSERRHANQMLDTIIRYCEREVQAEVAGVHVEILSLGSPVGDLYVRPSADDVPDHWSQEPLQDAKAGGPVSSEEED